MPGRRRSVVEARIPRSTIPPSLDEWPSHSSGTIELNWSAPTGATNYQVQATTSTIGRWLHLGGTTGTSRSFPVHDGATWKFRVRARGDGITRSAEWSNWSSSYKATNGPPPAASTPKIKGTTSSTATLEIGLISGIRRYQVRWQRDGGSWTNVSARSASSAGAFAAARRSATAASSSTTISLSQSGNYKVQVRYEGDGSRYTAQYGGWSNSLNFGFAFDCRYTTNGDNPHISSSSAGDKKVASAHGWWETTTPHKCPSHAWVTVWLQGWSCNASRTRCSFEVLDRNKGRRRPGSGSAFRVNVRNTCANTDEEVTYRSVIDVDLIGVWDGPGRETVQEHFYCYPAHS